MDKLDEKLFNDLSLETEIPDNYTIIVQETLRNINPKKKKEIHFTLPKIATVACVALLVTGGIAYAGVTISDYIWKQPEKVVGFYSKKNEENINADIDENILSKEDSIEKVKEALNKFKYTNEKIKSIELINTPNTYQVLWEARTDNNILVQIDAKSGDFLGIYDENILNDEKIYTCRSTEQKVIKEAKKLCSKYGYSIETYNDVKAMSNIRSDNNNVESDSYIWTVRFAKKYDNLINNNESITLSFIPEINQVFSFYILNNKYENNPVEINKEKAKQIALKAEENTKINYTIKNVYINLEIAQMNGNAHLRTNDYEQYVKQQCIDYPSDNYVDYRTESKVRKVWAVTILYDILDNKNTLEEYYTYFVDTTTGEIIGGEIPLYTSQFDK